MAFKLPSPGRSRPAPMLSPEGRLKGTPRSSTGAMGVSGSGSYYLRAWHLRWFNDYRSRASRLSTSPSVVGFSLSGLNSRKVLEKLTDTDISGALPFMGCTAMDVGLIRAQVGRLSVTGELGYEIHCDAMEHVALRRMLLEAGADLGIKEYGFNALLSLRLEKSFGIWSAEFTQGYTPGMTGMDRWIAWDKGEFAVVSAIAERDGGPALRPVTRKLTPTGRCQRL